MKKILLPLTLTGLSFFIAGNALAGDSASMSVGGTIITGSCTPTLDIPVKDMGNIPYTSLKDEEYTDVNPSNTGATLSVNCTSAMMVAFSSVDNYEAQEGAVPGSVITDFDGSKHYPLIADSGKVVGAWQWSAEKGCTVDGAPADIIYSKDNGTNWTKASTTTFNYPLRDNPIYSIHESAASTVAPKAFSNASFVLAYTALLGSRSELILTDRITYQGSATLSLIYL